MTAHARPAELQANALTVLRTLERLLGRPIAWLAACYEDHAPTPGAEAARRPSAARYRPHAHWM